MAPGPAQRAVRAILRETEGREAALGNFLVGPKALSSRDQCTLYVGTIYATVTGGGKGGGIDPSGGIREGGTEMGDLSVVCAISFYEMLLSVRGPEGFKSSSYWGREHFKKRCPPCMRQGRGNPVRVG